MQEEKSIEQPKKKLTAKTVLLNMAKLGLSVLAIYLISRKVDFSLVGEYIADINWIYFCLAIVAFFLSKLVSALRLNRYYRTQQIIIPEAVNAKLYFNAMFYNIFIPLVGGEAYKIFWIRREYTAETKPLIWSALLDRGSGLLALVILSVVFFNAFPNGISYSQWSWALLPLALAGAWAIHYLFFRSFLPAFNSTTFLSIIVQILQVVTIYFVILSLGIAKQITAYIFVFLISSFAYVLPFLGARELAFVYGAEYLGLDNELSLVISLLFYMALAINSLAGAIFFFLPIKATSDVSH